MYVFDRYVDYDRFDRMTDDGYFFVSRLKKNAITREIEPFSLPVESRSYDKMVLIGSTQNRMEKFLSASGSGRYQRVYPSADRQPVRYGADEISEIYRSRSAIGLFYKWSKQHVEINTFIDGRNCDTKPSLPGAHHLLPVFAHPTEDEKTKHYSTSADG